MMQNDFFYNRLLRLPLFQGLGKGDFIEIAGRTRLEFQTFPKGSILVKQDELCTGLYFVIDGEVCSSRWSVDKKYELKEWFALPCVLQPESVFGLVTCYTRTFIAASPLQVLRVEKNAVRDILFDYSTFRINYLNFLSSAVQNKEKTDNKLLKEEIDDEDIANVVSKWTGIPVNKLVESEKQKLVNMEDILHKRLIGQDEAVETVSDAIRRARSGLKDPKRPIGTFLFLGPTGVGKTELAKSLAEFMFNDEDALVRIDMSEYMEKHNVARLVGAPPGYVGYEEGGQLTEAVRRKPYSVVLFDEIEKAHPDVFNIMLQIFDDGRLTDSKGRTVDFKNTLIIMTSNIGSDIILENTLNSMLSPNEFDETKEKVMAVLRSRFKPEFLNRIDETIFFKALTLQDLSQIVDIQMDYLRRLLKDQELELEVTPDAKEFLATRGYNPVYGARPLKRVIRQLVENPLSKMILSQNFLSGDKVKIDVADDEIKFERIPASNE